MDYFQYEEKRDYGKGPETEGRYRGRTQISVKGDSRESRSEDRTLIGLGSMSRHRLFQVVTTGD